MSAIFRINWRRGASHPSHFVLIETEHETIDALLAALAKGMVAVDELYFDRTHPRAWKITRRERIAIRGDEVLSITGAPDYIDATSRSRARA